MKKYNTQNIMSSSSNNEKTNCYYQQQANDNRDMDQGTLLHMKSRRIDTLSEVPYLPPTMGDIPDGNF